MMHDDPETHRPAIAAPCGGTAVRLHHEGPLAAGATVSLDESTAHHALRVLRLRDGATVELFNGDGARYRGALTVEPGGRAATVVLTSVTNGGTESRLDIRLAQALPGGDKMDWLIEKATELGASAIQPLQTRRCVVRLEAPRAARRLEHWRRVIVAACMQCGRDHLPVINPVRDLDDWIGTVDAGPAVNRLVLTPGAEIGLRELEPSAGTIWLLAGPEGGLTETELGLAVTKGWTPLRLGPRVLRTETAGLAAIAALQARFGDF